MDITRDLFETEEDFTLRVTIIEDLAEKYENLPEATLLMLASAIVKKIRYGVEFDAQIEIFINKLIVKEKKIAELTTKKKWRKK